MNEGYVHGFNSGMEAVQQLRGDAEDMCPNWREGAAHLRPHHLPSGTGPPDSLYSTRRAASEA